MPKKEKLPKQAKHEKQQKKRKGRSVQDFIGVKTFTKYGLMTQKGELLFYLVSPTNISVLSYVNIEIKIRHLMMVLSSIPDIEITCTDSSECFDDNKAYRQHRRGLSRDAHSRLAAEVPAHEFLSAIQRLRRPVPGLPLHARKRQPYYLRSQHAQRNHVLFSQRISERGTPFLRSDDLAGNGGRCARVHHLCGCLCR